MKPLHLNLASRPYRDYRPLYAVVVASSLLIAFLMLNNIETYYTYVSDTRSTRAKIDSLTRETAAEKERAATAEQQLRTADLGRLDSEARFINARLAERAFSWSELLERLEQVLPADVRVRTITPTFEKNGTVHLELAFDAKEAGGMLESITRFQKDRSFANAFPHQESEGAEGGYLFTLGVDYRPTVARVMEK